MSPSDPSTSADRRGVLLAVVVAAAVAGAVRWWVHRELHANDPTLLAPALDDAYYVDVARRISAGERFDAFLAPLHPRLAVLLASGPALDVGLLGGINAVLGALTSGLVALGAGLAAGRRAAWVGGALHALAGVFLFHDVLPGQEAGIGLATAVVIACGIALADGRLARLAPSTAAALGAAVGVAALGRGTSLALLACAAPGVVRLRGRLRSAALCAAGLAVVLLGGSLANQRSGGAFSPFPWSGGVNLYLGNGPDARSTLSMTAAELGAHPAAIERNARAVPAAAEGRSLAPRETSGWWVRRTLATAAGAGEMLGHLGRKALLFWTSDERGSNHAAHAERDFATLLRVVPVSGWWLLALGVGAWWFARRAVPAADVPALAVAGSWLALTVFFPVDRYRLPALVASTVLVGIASAVRPGRRRVVTAAAVTAVVAAAAWLPLRPRDDAAGHVGVAQAMVELGRPLPEIDRRLDRALDADPGCGPALELRGRLRYAAGRPDAAYDLYVRAARDRRSRFSAQVAALPALVDLGRLVEARDVAHGLLAERPDDAQLLAHAAIVSAAAGGMEPPGEFLRRARAIAPEHPAIRFAESRLR